MAKQRQVRRNHAQLEHLEGDVFREVKFSLSCFLCDATFEERVDSTAEALASTLVDCDGDSSPLLGRMSIPDDLMEDQLKFRFIDKAYDAGWRGVNAHVEGYMDPRTLCPKCVAVPVRQRAKLWKPDGPAEGTTFEACATNVIRELCLSLNLSLREHVKHAFDEAPLATMQDKVSYLSTYHPVELLAIRAAIASLRARPTLDPVVVEAIR